MASTAPQAGRVKFLGNVWQGLGRRVFRDADPARTAQAGNEADAGPRRRDFAIDTDAYARNVFYDVGKGFGQGGRVEIGGEANFVGVETATILEGNHGTSLA